MSDNMMILLCRTVSARRVTTAWAVCWWICKAFCKLIKIFLLNGSFFPPNIMQSDYKIIYLPI